MFSKGSIPSIELLKNYENTPLTEVEETEPEELVFDEFNFLFYSVNDSECNNISNAGR